MAHLSKLNNYLKLMVKAYAEIRSKQTQHAIYRLIDHKKNNTGEYEITVQLIGKSLVFKSTPKEIMANDDLLESFSKKDIRLLTYLACQDIQEPKYEILGQKFIRNMNKFFFRLKHAKTGEEMEKSATEISADSSLIKSLTPEDAHTIGYVTANEQIKEEKKQQN